LPFEKAGDLHSQAWVQIGTWLDRRADPQHKRCADNHTHRRPWCSMDGQKGGH